MLALTMSKKTKSNLLLLLRSMPTMSKNTKSLRLFCSGRTMRSKSIGRGAADYPLRFTGILWDNNLRIVDNYLNELLAMI